MEKFTLKENMRAKLDPEFSNFLLRIGDGRENCVIDDKIRIPTMLLLDIEDCSPIETLIDVVFPHLCSNKVVDDFVNRAILCPKNDVVDEINNNLIDKFPGALYEYLSFDSALDSSQLGLQEDLFNTLTPCGFPPHKLLLKKNCPVMLLRNVDPSKGLCNGTRLICKRFQQNMIDAEIATGSYKGDCVFLTRIPLLPTENENTVYPFKRIQFPLRLCFAMTINKAQ